ncbi:hypothetical protein TCAL_04427 [Tigriopus californicus]|uniref:Peptidase M28 domain-containing protein n=1 Tax=Tigriopus californicus TaxID=6832 RepID=A0A553NUF5_TIGCA|nr:N-acetylated-alpha-linked acidic dipeptidase 2-like [Tigriopus californicus]XP_059084677.1 N-acetylated-alpha-linked acidic dipeptidase 2-like [Tigriopus californicus]XP_059084684.1 N-acetylated-alpha-linked acidic dipeptidase 2-like [Tigriopus californicus]XP_059084691.1 N-acetylated-alpha-linked acidic dipeptidase 2-like [Tigriopus californicus]TRY69059.1 hypothetical protein TCAL_04427 [Tigriopus californicus]
MPSPLRSKESGSFAYTRWEAVESEDTTDSPITETPFYSFEEEVPATSTATPAVPWPLSPNRLTRPSMPNGHSHGSQGPISPRFDVQNSRCLSISIRTMVILVMLGVGGIIGFVARWGVHRYFVDPQGHCMTPIPFQYNAEMAKHAIDTISFSSIRDFFEEFTSENDHELGSIESSDYARSISQLWREFGIQKTELDVVKTMIPVANLRDHGHVPCEITIKDVNGTTVWSKDLDAESMAQVSYSASAIGQGQLMYGHYGRFEDFHEMGLNFSGSVVIMKLSQLYHVGSMVRNAQYFGAKAVILFPDPVNHLLTGNVSETKIKISPNESLSASAKLFPGDPYSPYFPGKSKESIPDIPVISITFSEAQTLLSNFTNAYNLTTLHTYGLPLDTQWNMNFTAMVEVNLDYEKRSIRNVIGTIPGAYEPTRYIIIGAHHDTWWKGSSQAGLGHSVLMELARVFGYLRQHSWKPGRSIIFASWDGEEIGQLGSTSWMNSHSKELNTRAVAYINLDYVLTGSSTVHIAATPLFREIIERAAKSVPCITKKNIDDDCTLFSTWIDEDAAATSLKSDKLMMSDPQHSFQSILGVSTIEVALKTLAMPYPHTNSSMDTVSAIKTILDPEFKHAALVARFLTILLLQLTMTPNLPGSVSDYANKIHSDIHTFIQVNDKDLEEHDVNVGDMVDALNKFEVAAFRFHSTYDPSFPLEFLGHHEFSDQLMELERSFLLPASYSELSGQPIPLLRSPYKHIIYGPDPLNQGMSVLFPQLSGALKLARYLNTTGLWDSVRREAFFVVDALESASCVLENHLVHTYVDDVNHPMHRMYTS